MTNEFWDERYSSDEYAYGILPNKYFKEQIDKLKPGKLFLPGEGEGRNAVYAAKLGWDVTALDYSVMAQEKAMKLAEENNVKIKYHVIPINEYIFPVSEFDASSLIFVPIPENLRALIHKNIIRSLKPGGVLIAELFSKKQINNNSGGSKDLSLLCDIDELLHDFKEMDIIEGYETQINLNEGQYHQGKADVIRILAKIK